VEEQEGRTTANAADEGNDTPDDDESDKHRSQAGGCVVKTEDSSGGEELSRVRRRWAGLRSTSDVPTGVATMRMVRQELAFGLRNVLFAILGRLVH